MSIGTATSLLSDREASRIKVLMLVAYGSYRELIDLEKEYLQIRGMVIRNDGKKICLMKDQKELISIPCCAGKEHNKSDLLRFEKDFSLITDQRIMPVNPREWGKRITL